MKNELRKFSASFNRSPERAKAAIEAIKEVCLLKTRYFRWLHSLTGEFLLKHKTSCSNGMCGEFGVIDHSNSEIKEFRLELTRLNK